MRIPALFAAAIMLAALLPIHAQERRSGSATNTYVVEFHFRDGGDAATATDRRYSLRVNGEHKATFRVGTRTPTVSASFEPLSANPLVNNPLVNTQYTYLDVGVNIECTLLELDTRVELHSAIVLSSLAEKEAAPATGSARNPTPNPTIKETKVDLSATLVIGRPSMLASIADPVTNRMLQITATITAAN